jgi:acyl carrier protein
MNDVTIESLKQILKENCMVKIDLDSLGEEIPLFGPDSIGLDSLDALQITIAVEKRFGVVMGDPATAREALKNLRVLRDWIIRAMEVKSSVTEG